MTDSVSASAIFGPLFTLLLLTLVVWVVMYIRRMAFLLTTNTNLRKVDTPAKMDDGVPVYINLPAYAFKNLLELPLIFYVLWLFLFVTERVDQIYLIAAWVFVVGRVVHSAIYCTYNKVLHRFAVYFVSACALWFMALRAGSAIFL